MRPTSSAPTVERKPPKWVRAGISTPSNSTRDSAGAAPQTTKPVAPGAARATPGRSCAASAGSPPVPGRCRAASASTAVPTGCGVPPGAAHDGRIRAASAWLVDPSRVPDRWSTDRSGACAPREQQRSMRPPPLWRGGRSQDAGTSNASAWMPLPGPFEETGRRRGGSRPRRCRSARRRGSPRRSSAPRPLRTATRCRRGPGSSRAVAWRLPHHVLPAPAIDHATGIGIEVRGCRRCARPMRRPACPAAAADTS